MRVRVSKIASSLVVPAGEPVDRSLGQADELHPVEALDGGGAQVDDRVHLAMHVEAHLGGGRRRVRFRDRGRGRGRGRGVFGLGAGCAG